MHPRRNTFHCTYCGAQTSPMKYEQMKTGDEWEMTVKEMTTGFSNSALLSFLLLLLLRITMNYDGALKLFSFLLLYMCAWSFIFVRLLLLLFSPFLFATNDSNCYVYDYFFFFFFRFVFFLFFLILLCDGFAFFFIYFGLRIYSYCATDWYGATVRASSQIKRKTEKEKVNKTFLTMHSALTSLSSPSHSMPYNYYDYYYI